MIPRDPHRQALGLTIGTTDYAWVLRNRPDGPESASLWLDPPMA